MNSQIHVALGLGVMMGAVASAEPQLDQREKAEQAAGLVARLEVEDLSGAERSRLISATRALCADIQLGGINVWYGHSLVTSARLCMVEGAWGDARTLLLDQAETLQHIERNIAAHKVPVSSISPVAGCRFILAETYLREYEESGSLKAAADAFKHGYNVHVKYGDSEWGPRAGEQARVVREIIESHGGRIRIDLGPHRATYVANMFKLGARLTAEKEYEAAIEPLETALNVYPESSKSMAALGWLGRCHVGLAQDEEAFATGAYLGERFGADTNAATAALSIGRAFMEAGEESKGAVIFEGYLASFPNDAHRVSILSYLAWRDYKAEQWDAVGDRFAALEKELRVRGESGEPLEKAVYIQARHPADAHRLSAFLREFPESSLAPSAMEQQAGAQLVAGEFDAAFNTLEELGERYPNAPEAKGALGGLIIAAVEAEHYDIAEQVLVRMRSDTEAYGAEVYLATGERLLAAQKYALAEQAYAAAPKDDERATYGLGRARYGAERWADCVAALDRLMATHPKTAYYREAQLTRARALVRLQRLDEAMVAYGEVISLRSELGVSLELAAILPHSEARLAAYQRVALLADPEVKANLPMIEQSLLASFPLGVELARYQLVVRSCDQFTALFPNHDQSSLVANYRMEAERALVH